MASKIERLRERADKLKKDTFAFRTSFYGFPMLIAVNGKQVIAKVQAGKILNVAVSKKMDTDTRDDKFGVTLAKERAALAALKSVKAAVVQQLDKEITQMEDRVKSTIETKYGSK